MGFLGRVGQGIKNAGQTAFEELKRRQQIIDTKKRILNRFEMKELKKICRNYGIGEPSNYDIDIITGKRYRKPVNRNHYVGHVVRKLNLEQIKNYANKNRIDIWDVIKENRNMYNKNEYPIEDSIKDREVTKIEVTRQTEFDNILDDIENNFEAEDCRDEAEFEKLLTIFLKNKYNTQRQVKTAKGRIDILIDNRYVLEIKIADSKSSLDKGISEVKKYSKIFDNIAVIIFDVNRLGSNTIKEYIEDYQDLGAKTLVLRGNVRRRKRKSTKIIIKH